MTDAIISSVPDGYTCQHCGKHYVREQSYYNHRCNQMERNEAIRTLDGKRAFIFYGEWMSCRRLRSPNINTFMDSKSFQPMYRFTKWVSLVHIPNPHHYIRVMVMWKLNPELWTRDDVYVKYIDFIDRTSTVDDHIRNTYATLTRISNAAGVALRDSLLQLHPNEVLEYVRARKLSPWLLLKMSAFQQMYSSASPSQQVTIQTIIRPAYWREKFASYPTETKDVIEFIKAVGL